MRCEVCADLTDPAKSEIECHIEVTLCLACKYDNRLPWDVLVGLVLSSGLQGAESLRHYIEATCDYYGRSEGELWAEVEQTEHEYNQSRMEALNGEAGT
jgi:hypothetical protein